MSEENNWAPAPRRSGKRFDWNAAPEVQTEETFEAVHIPAQETNDGLGDLFEAEETPLGVPEQGTPSGGLDDLFGAEEPAPAELGDLFGEENTDAVPEHNAESSGLGDLFGDTSPLDELPSPVAQDASLDDSDLDDLFAEAPVEKTPATFAAVSTVEDATKDRAAVADDLLDMFAETAEEVPLAEVPAGDFWNNIPLPEPEAPKAKEETTVEERASSEEAVPSLETKSSAVKETELVEEKPVEAEVPSLTSLAGVKKRTLAPPAVVTAAREVTSLATGAPKVTPIAKEEVKEVAAEVAEELVPSEKVVTVPGTRLGLAARRQAADEASVGLEDDAVARARVEMMTAYAIPDHIWSYVDRLLGYVSGQVHIQSVVNPFVLTRDKLLDAEQRRMLEQVIAPQLMDAGIQIHNPRDAEATFDLAYDELIGTSVLGPLWRDDTITEIMVDGWDRIVVEKNGTLIPTPLKFRDKQHAARVARDLAAKISDRGLTPTNPLVTAQLPGARVTFAYGAVVKSGLSISLRKFVDLLGMEKLLEFGALTPEMAEFLHQAVQGRANIIVAGGTGTGKTTQINALSEFIPDGERVITIEDAFELQLSNANVVSLQTKEKSSADDTVVITQDMLLVNTLRMRPDRVIVGEIREGHGAVVMLQAANTGHDGTMTTIHAQTPEVALNERLADMVMEVTHSPSEVVRRSVASAVDLVVQVTRKNGRRFISDIAIVDRSCFKDGVIVPESVFTGEVSSQGTVTFRHVGGVRRETSLGMKMEEEGFDPAQWDVQK